MSLLRLLSASLCFSVPVLPQELLWEREGVENQYQLGGPVETVGDLDGDSYLDLMCFGQWFAPPKWPAIFFLSGKDGSTIRTSVSASLSLGFRNIAAAGDMNADLVPDYVVTYPHLSVVPNLQIVEVRSGADDSVLWALDALFGYCFACAMLGDVDLDGDGKPDLVVTAPNETPYGKVYAYRNDGTLWFALFGTPELQFPFASKTCLGRIGDFDGDGHEDFLLGAIDAVAGRGAVVVVSGAGGQILAKGLGPNAFEAVGHAVDGAGDMDGDGVLDFVASTIGGLGERGVAMAFSGATGQALWTWWGTGGGAGFGGSLGCSGQDFDQDGLPDVVVGERQTSIAYLFSGRDGSLIHKVVGPGPSTRLGLWLDVLPPQPGHPFPVVALPEPKFGMYISQWGPTEEKGRIRLFRGNPQGVDYLGPGCNGRLSTAPRIGFTDMGSAVRVHLSNEADELDATAVAAPATLLLGLRRASLNARIAHHPFDLPGCQVYPLIQWTPTVTTGSAGINAGYASLDIPMPLGNGNPQLRLYGQWLVGGTGALSGGLTWVH